MAPAGWTPLGVVLASLESKPARCWMYMSPLCNCELDVHSTLNGKSMFLTNSLKALPKRERETKQPQVRILATQTHCSGKQWMLSSPLPSFLGPLVG